MVATVSAITRNPVVPVLLLMAAFAAAEPGFIDRDEVEPGVYAVLRNGQAIFLECTPPSGKDAQPFLQKYLADPGTWKMYADKGAVAILFDRLSPEAQRQALITLFPLDYIDEEGWWHTVRFSTPDCSERLASLATWLTGSPENAARICSHKQNRSIGDLLKRGDRILIPQPLLLPVMRTLKAPPPSRKANPSPPKHEESPVTDSNEDASTTPVLLSLSSTAMRRSAGISWKARKRWRNIASVRRESVLCRGGAVHGLPRTRIFSKPARQSHNEAASGTHCIRSGTEDSHALRCFRTVSSRQLRKTPGIQSIRAESSALPKAMCERPRGRRRNSDSGRRPGPGRDVASGPLRGRNRHDIVCGSEPPGDPNAGESLHDGP